MGARESIQKQLDKKLAEKDKAEEQLAELRVYIQALQDMIRLLPKEGDSQSAIKELRAGSVLAQVQEFLKKEGSPQHISTILQFLGKPLDKQNRVSLSGSLGGYAKEHRIFTRTGPNTFGLIEFQGTKHEEPQEESSDSLPEEFGKL